MQANGGGGAHDEHRGPVLLLKVTNQAYPVDLNTVKLILSKYGTGTIIAQEPSSWNPRLPPYFSYSFSLFTVICST